MRRTLSARDFKVRSYQSFLFGKRKKNDEQDFFWKNKINMFCLWQGEAFRYPRESWKSCLKEIIYSGKNQTVKQILFQMLFSGREWIDMYRLFDEEIFWESEGEENCYSQQKKWNSKSEFCFRGSLEKNKSTWIIY